MTTRRRRGIDIPGPIKSAFMVRQLLGTWLIGSAVTGTVAVLLTADRDDWPVRPLVFLSNSEFMTLVVLVAALFLALFALGWRTAETTWLRTEPRAVVLWTLLVGGVGFLGAAFAAAVADDAGASTASLLIISYAFGGLPYTLVAAMLAKPWRVNASAAALAVIAVLTGLALMDQPVSTLVSYLFILAGDGLRLS
jgi:hypothetical protein